MSSLVSRLRSLGRRLSGNFKPSITASTHQHSEHLHTCIAQVCPAPLNERIFVISKSSPLCMHQSHLPDHTVLHAVAKNSRRSSSSCAGSTHKVSQ